MAGPAFLRRLGPLKTIPMALEGTPDRPFFIRKGIWVINADYPKDFKANALPKPALHPEGRQA